MTTILIVEDEGLLALDLWDWIELEDDLEAISVASIALAEKAIEGNVEFVLLDVNVLDGCTFGLARELMARRIPFAITSGSNPNDIPMDLRLVPFISKPYGRRTVIAAVRDGLSRGHRGKFERVAKIN